MHTHGQVMTFFYTRNQTDEINKIHAHAEVISIFSNMQEHNKTQYYVLSEHCTILNIMFFKYGNSTITIDTGHATRNAINILDTS